MEEQHQLSMARVTTGKLSPTRLISSQLQNYELWLAKFEWNSGLNSW